MLLDFSVWGNVMPVLDSNFVATWWYFTDPVTGNAMFLENFSESQNTSAVKRPMLQGEIGTHVMNTDGSIYETSASSPILIFQGNTLPLSNLFDSVADAFSAISALQSNTPGSPVSMIKTASISFSKSAISVEATFWSSAPGLFGYTDALVTPAPDFIARTATFYDTVFSMNFSFTDPSAVAFLVIDGEIEFEVDIESTYMIGSFNVPWFSAQNYHVKGNLTVVAQPGSIYPIPFQQPGFLVAYGSSSMPAGLSLNIAGSDVQLGSGNITLNPTASFKLNADQVMCYTTTFETYATAPGFFGSNS